jgi:hypothetical protein
MMAYRLRPVTRGHKIGKPPASARQVEQQANVPRHKFDGSGQQFQGTFRTALGDSAFAGQEAQVTGIHPGGCIHCAFSRSTPAGDTIASVTGLLREGRLETPWHVISDSAVKSPQPGSPPAHQAAVGASGHDQRRHIPASPLIPAARQAVESPPDRRQTLASPTPLGKMPAHSHRTYPVTLIPSRAAHGTGPIRQCARGLTRWPF